MASPLRKIEEFLRSRQGRRLTEQAKAYARDPRNREKAKQMLDKLRKGGGRFPRH
jgi:hypothetical protein